MLRPIAVLLSLLALLPTSALPPQQPATYEALKQTAEASYAEKSFGRAHDLYEQASRVAPQAEKRWVTFRLADTQWRTDAANPTSDQSALNEARAVLDSILRDPLHDRVWAEAQESFGDSWWTNPRFRDVNQALPYYQSALEWWASSSDLALARQRYLDIVFRINWSSIPQDILVNAVSIAESKEDRAHARYLLATALVNQYQPEPVERGLELLDAIIGEGKTTAWYDDALFSAASQLAQRGNVVVDENGDAQIKPDYVRALDRYRKLVQEFRSGETQYWQQAKDAIDSILGPSVNVAVQSTFLPRSEQEVVLSWRNVTQIALRLTPVDLIDDAHVTSGRSWTDSIASSDRTPIRKWTFDTNDRGDHVPANQRVRVEPKLDRGAYILEASGGGKSSRQLLLVTDANIIVHSAKQRSDLLVCDALTGQPIAGAHVRIWQRQPNNSMAVRDAETGANGFATIAMGDYGGETFIAASAPGNRQAYVQSYSYGYSGRDDARWSIYAFTDRPAYRPDEVVHWKFIARVRQNNEWITPARDTLDYEIYSPRGEKVGSGKAALNDFGSFWSDLPLTASMPLGAYRIMFRKGSDGVGSANLFRLEEYKLPEFRVEVKTGDEKYRVGDTVEATIEASYYFGGPVANAEVQAVVYSRPFYRYWFPWREYDWYFQNERQSYYGGYGYRGQQISTQTLKTDGQGRATLRVPTQRDGGDVELHIEARVTDASRREVIGDGIVRVTKNRYSVVGQPSHFIHRPNDRVSVTFKALDANDKPVQTTGNVKVIRRAWRAVDKTPAYREEEILTTTARTDQDGEATISFVAPGTGYYAVQWTSEDREGDRPARARDLVHAETAVWVSSNASTELGYHTGGLEIIIDKESFRAGQTAPVIIATPASGRWVMLTTSANGILDTQIVHLDGTAKLVELPITDRNVPSFYITVSSTFDRMLWNDTKRIVVPPVEHFINVDVKSDRQDYRPRQEGSFTVTTRDVDGRPVAAEVALAVSDESVTAIQTDFAGDPRQFFFGADHAYAVQVTASVQRQRYGEFKEKEGKLIDDRDLKKDERDSFDRGLSGDVAGAALGRMAVAEAITVNAQAPAAAPPPALKAMKTNEETRGIEVHVRTDFSSTAFWKPNVVTGPDGVARVTMKFPEALTTWRATARAVTPATQVGIGSSTARTNMPLIVRLQGPRFFVAGDRATISAVVNNNTDQAMTVSPALEVEGVKLENAVAAGGSTLSVPAHGEARADWKVIAERAGSAKLRVIGRAGEYADAMEKTFTVYEHGVDKLIARSGKVRGDEAIIKLDLPRERRATELSIQVQPSLAAMMLDALPYLVEYPYGCTEQTMSRFLPAAIVARTLERNGLERSGIVSPRRIEDVTARSLARLYDFQHADGGWGWWKNDDSDDFMTAYVLWGLAIAREAGLNINGNSGARAATFLDGRLVQHESDWQNEAWILHALAAWRKSPTAEERKAFNDAYAHRDRVTSYSRALLALAAHDFGDAERAGVLVRNLEDGAKIDRAPDQSVLVRGSGSGAPEVMGTAHWGEDHFWWRWFDGPVESTAFALQAIVHIDPQNRLVEPIMNWMVKNRRGAQWNNTRDTAIAILALDDYLGVSGELKAGTAYEVSVNGRVLQSGTAQTRVSVPQDLVRDANEIRIRRTKGQGALYFAAEGRFVSLEEPVKAAGNEIFVRREYFRLAGHPTLLKGITFTREPLLDNGSATSGERVEVVATIETKNDYDYLMFEDLKPAGLEAVELQSGAGLWARDVKSNRSVPVYQELRDRKVALFISHLPQGIWEIRYTLRAEVPGSFHALPLLGQAMYVPEVHANGEEVRMSVE
ncbi:MAG TPA: alpha-2-macroglobulin family protein [Thermoanaerobaculia bacterium]|nr:alpha-2-macroglobulin family protein [Thermoanaerobaculia bacterium]